MIEQGLLGLNDLMQWSVVLDKEISNKIIKAQELSMQLYQLKMKINKVDTNKPGAKLKYLVYFIKQRKIENKIKRLAHGR